jgi:hypothetical protein
VAAVADIGGLVSNVVDSVKGSICPLTLGNEAATCNSGAGGLAIVALGILIYAVFDSFKDAATQATKDRPIGIAVILASVVLAIHNPNIYAIFFAFVPIAVWILFQRQLAGHQLRCRGRSMTLDTAVILLAPIAYLIVFGSDWTFKKLNPPPAKPVAIVLLASPYADRSNLKDILPQLRASLRDIINPHTYEVLPAQTLFDNFSDYLQKFTLAWNDVDSLPNTYTDLKGREIKFVRGTVTAQPYGANGGSLALTAEARSLDPAAPQGISPLNEVEASVKGVRSIDNMPLMLLLLSFPIIEHYAAGNASVESSLSQEYIENLKTAHFVDRLPPDIQATLRNGCTQLHCIDPIAAAFNDQLKTELTNAQPNLQQQAADNLNSASDLVKLNAGKTQ